MFITTSLMNGWEVSCSVTSSNPCVFPQTEHSSGIIVSTWATGVQEVSGNGSVYSLLPNPNKGTFTISGSVKGTNDDKVIITVTDVLGQTVHTATATIKNGTISEKITLDNSLANGMYLVHITSGADKAVFHMVLDK